MNKRLLSILIIALVWSASVKSEDITVNFRDVELMAVLEFYSELTGKVFVPSASVAGQVTVISPGPVSEEQAVKLLFSILDMRGFAVVETDDFYKIVQKNKAISSAAEPLRPRVAGDRLVTEVVKPEYVNVGAIFQSLQALVSPEGKLVPDSNLNTLVITDTAANVKRFKQLLAQLDKPVSQPVSRTYQLQYAKVKEMAPLITTFLQGATAGPAGPGARGPVTPVLQDVRSNALIVRAPESIQQEIAAILEELDHRSPQVLLEATIVEVALNESSSLGVQWQFFLSRMDPTALLTLSEQGGSPIVGTPDVLPVLPALQGLTFALLKPNDYAALIDLLASDRDARVLSSPHLIASNNKESSLRIGDEVPFLKEFRLDDQSNPIRTFDRLKVGLELKITPSIADNRDVSLQILIKLSTVVAGSVTGDNQFTTAEREVQTNVVVKDRKALVISGLIRDNADESNQGVPFLRRLPGLGKLMGTDTMRGERRELLVIIRPLVVTSEDEARLVSDIELRKHPNAVKAGALNPDVMEFDL